MRAAAVEASTMMKTLGHSGRLMILCHLADGEKSVGELVDLLNMPQSSLSQHLARMRAENLVETRRESQAVYYRL
ncbi:MAG: winged helix-turn-helix transcriptional regulator [Woeseiaceae bacterium]|nr:winged helix-turn-helix transcriptional regulator [Woeseiaceae bacterium]